MSTKHAKQWHACIHAFMCTRPYACCNIYICNVHVCKNIYTYARMPCTHILINVYNYVCMYIYSCMYVCMHAICQR